MKILRIVQECKFGIFFRGQTCIFAQMIFGFFLLPNFKNIFWSEKSSKTICAKIQVYPREKIPNLYSCTILRISHLWILLMYFVRISNHFCLKKFQKIFMIDSWNDIWLKHCKLNNRNLLLLVFYFNCICFLVCYKQYGA